MKRLIVVYLAMCFLLSMTACMKNSASVGVIGGADGPTEVYVTD